MRFTETAKARVDGTWETSKKVRWYQRLTLRRADGKIYLDRWGFGPDHIGRVLLHKMSAPDPGIDLHDHPWRFVSIVLWGGYDELRAETRDAPALARTGTRGVLNRRRAGSVQYLGQHECHTITSLHRRSCWTLVIRGRRRRQWGFYLPDGWLDEPTYDNTVRAERRDLWSEQNEGSRPW